MKLLSLDNIKTAVSGVKTWALARFIAQPTIDGTPDLGSSTRRFGRLYSTAIDVTGDVRFNYGLSLSTLAAQVGRLVESQSALSSAIEDVREMSQKNQGLYLTADKLQNAHPNPSVGDWAYVGNGFPAAIYLCEQNGVWTNTGAEYTGGNVSLDEYATKNYVNNRFQLVTDDEHALLKAQNLIDANTLYMSPEEE
ncbi:MAG: hypothetical protein IJ551_01795 [Prevotella sp.]|nr:hypothetical protein [Prevotella sp.]